LCRSPLSNQFTGTFTGTIRADAVTPFRIQRAQYGKIFSAEPRIA
jgi:hypothetical protein